MTDREAFEAWLQTYSPQEKRPNIAFDAYRAGADWALERAAVVCDGETKIAHGEFGAGWVAGAKACITALRALKDQP